ncbi:threonine aldolase family protein [Parvibaculum sp.]|uniref:threonine aldolase family protein n=1 Tax=Parvibaculum sp. TaxID=2024848 RepID=UPI003919645F
MNFASDNTAGAAPEIMAALQCVNEGNAVSYGGDEATARLKARFAEIFEHEVDVFPVVTGTAANALSLAAIAPPYGAVICHELSHIHLDECGAPEMFSGGAKLLPVGGAGGKVDPAAVKSVLDAYPAGIVHHVQPAALSLTQSTELGAVYSVGEIAALAGVARTRGLRLHMDGARFANAVANLNVPPAELTWKVGIDILSFGATKNGALAAEAVIVFNRDIGSDLAFRRKRAGHLLSKMRFVSAQLEAYLEDGLWLRLAAHANEMTARLAQGLAAAGAEMPVAPQANEIFPRLPAGAVERLRSAGARFHPWPMAGDSAEFRTIRLVTSFQTTEDEIGRFLAVLGA